MGTNLPAPMPQHISKAARKCFARICIYFFGVMSLTLLFTPSLNATQQFGISSSLHSKIKEHVSILGQCLDVNNSGRAGLRDTNDII